jgi:hypothetical protein
MVVAKATIAPIIDYDYASMEADVQTRKSKIVEAGVFVEVSVHYRQHFIFLPYVLNRIYITAYEGCTPRKFRNNYKGCNPKKMLALRAHFCTPPPLSIYTSDATA